MAKIVANQRFNESKHMDNTIYHGYVSNGLPWLFLRLEGDVVKIDLTDYPLQPVDELASAEYMDGLLVIFG